MLVTQRNNCSKVLFALLQGEFFVSTKLLIFFVGSINTINERTLLTITNNALSFPVWFVKYYSPKRPYFSLTVDIEQEFSLNNKKASVATVRRINDLAGGSSGLRKIISKIT